MKKQTILYIIIAALVVLQVVTLAYFNQYKKSTPRGLLEKYSAQFQAKAVQKNLALTAGASGTGRDTRCWLYLSEFFSAVADGDDARAEDLAGYFVEQCM